MWKLKGYTVDAFDQTQVVYNIWANTKNDLPSTMTDIGYGTALGFGSTAQTFDDSKEWRWNGTQWVEQTNGQEIEISADDIVYDNTDSGLTATNVKDAIDEINDAVQTKADKGSFDITVAGSPLVTSEYSYSCIVTGDIATVCIRLILGDALDVNTSRNLFKIPVGYRPPQSVAGTGYADGKVRVFWINTSGDVKIRIDEAIPAGATINVNFCYSYNSKNWTTVTANASLQSLNSPLLLNRNDLNEQLDSNFDLIDSIPEEEEGEEDDI